MDLKRYEKTRYQNIYRNKKKKNYIIRITNPETSISSIDGKKIFNIDEAKKIRDNALLRIKKKVEIECKDTFDELWNKYHFECKYIKKQAYNTLIRKEKVYNKYLMNQFHKAMTKISRNDLVNYIDNLNTTDKEKNQIIKELKIFYNWCVYNELIYINPMSKIKYYKVPKSRMKYWLPDEVKKFFSYINTINTEAGYRTKIIVLLGFTLGDRIGETRALTFNDIDTQNNKIYLKHSINYNRKSTEFFNPTKNEASSREIDISPIISNEIIGYKEYLKSRGYNVKNDNLIILNYKTEKPYTDTTLRNQFHEFCDKANVRRIRLYDLRHTYVATMMAEGKELYLISERLGHSSFATTVNKYGHLSNDVRKEMALLTDKYL